MQSFSVIMTKPLPLQAFWPLSLMLVLHSDLPLHSLAPKHLTLTAVPSFGCTSRHVGKKQRGCCRGDGRSNQSACFFHHCTSFEVHVVPVRAR